MNDVELLRRWLLHSGIQNLGGETAAHGGFHSWYDPATQAYPYIYSETTGYGITTLLFMHELEPDPHCLLRARLAADWIVHVGLTFQGGVKARYYARLGADDRYAFEKGWLVTFDTAVVLFGMSELFGLTRETGYLRAAEAMATFLLGMQKPDGSIHAHYDAPRDLRHDAGPKWSTQSGAFHAKIAMGFLSLHDHTGAPRYLEAARLLCEQALRHQQPDGRFVTTVHDGGTLQHAHCYAAEGLLYCGQRLAEERYVDAARRAVEWSLGTQLESGGIPQVLHGSAGAIVAYERTDILGQVLRLAAFLHGAGIARFAEERLVRLRDRLLSFQHHGGAQDGGIQYGYEADGTRYEHLNSWCSMFALQALAFHDQMRRGEQPRLRYLV